MQATSDAHFGDLSARDDRSRADRQLFCDTLPADDLIICGDFCDIQRFGWQGCMDANMCLFTVLRGHVQKGHRVILGCGNHDPDPAFYQEALEGATICKRIVVSKKYYTHGDDYDLFCGRWPKIGAAVVGVGNTIGHVSPRLEDFCAGAAGKIQNTGRYGQDKELARRALDFIRYWPGIDTAVCGHSHVRSEAQDRGKKYVNLGCFERGKPIWTQL